MAPHSIGSQIASARRWRRLRTAFGWVSWIASVVAIVLQFETVSPYLWFLVNGIAVSVPVLYITKRWRTRIRRLAVDAASRYHAADDGAGILGRLLGVARSYGRDYLQPLPTRVVALTRLCFNEYLRLLPSREVQPSLQPTSQPERQDGEH
jgi:hypothetical protein